MGSVIEMGQGQQAKAGTDVDDEGRVWHLGMDAEERRVMLGELAAEGAEIIAAEGPDGFAGSARVMAGACKRLKMPKHLSAGMLNPSGYYADGLGDDPQRYERPWEQEQLGLMEALYEVRALCHEFQLHRRVRLRVRWFTPLKQKHGRMAVGDAKVISASDRDCWPEAAGMPPTFDLYVSLAWWLVAGPMERRRGLHAILSLCGIEEGERGLKFSKRQPDMVAFTTTLARFGAHGMGQAAAFAAMANHGATHEEVARYEFDDDGQGSLFAPYVIREPDEGRSL